MTGSLRARMAKLERGRRGPVAYCLELPHEHGAWSSDPALADAALASAIAEHQARTGYLGPVLVGLVPCASAEEWMRRYGREAAP